MKTYGLILAAGKGTRMQSELPKCAYPILRKPMIEYIVENMEKSMIDDVVVIVGHKKEYLIDLLGDRVSYAEQKEQLGTGHAVLSAKNVLGDKEGVTFIIPGDVPLVPYQLMDKILCAHKEMGNDLTVVSMMMDYPKSYGRIVRDEYGTVIGIVEENDCNEYQKLIKEVNTGIYVVDNKKLFEALEKIKLNERKKEYYLTDIVAIMYQDYKVNSFVVRYPHLAMGVNDLYGISVAEKHLRESINKELMLSGVAIMNPETVTIGHSVVIEKGVSILPNTTITGNTVIKANAVIGPNTEIHESIINENAHIRHSYVYDSEIGENTTVGPFAHIREHSVIGSNNRVGNFVEIKKSTTGNDTKMAHLSYIGDSEVGNFVNFGCGSVTVNYDGKLKHKTKIGNDVFIGCNVNLIAPIEIGDNVFLAAGSTVTENVPSGSLAIARNRQINKEDYSKNLIQPKSKVERSANKEIKEDK
ncbi:bifunctional UDP-N-acetylglucosamine diphosphorylase/glucosamine-1-phosphate N-acetyltransferase GlmU [Haploplasma axanthum]|uniref:Bifunctional protein GlmU n=1 Tax=Haploplasma axanthum TaxID=29552 RepID=A0A449BC37_HAPAX|nr:bifunctional UDP-N-acetylglucosamine diphosphorylase/glucosamine-1-phosphate N-acetyltransferase GlmU [Haploplasma axanthum]VEU79992.1 UTP-glucose-1-phosphate uridylyltransferase [Haploplasma axanthum]